MLVNCAGTSFSAKFEEVEVDRFKVSSSDKVHLVIIAFFFKHKTEVNLLKVFLNLWDC